MDLYREGTRSISGVTGPLLFVSNGRKAALGELVTGADEGAPGAVAGRRAARDPDANPHPDPAVAGAAGLSVP